jgi:hypothetical protein
MCFPNLSKDVKSNEAAYGNLFMLPPVAATEPNLDVLRFVGIKACQQARCLIAIQGNRWARTMLATNEAVSKRDACNKEAVGRARSMPTRKSQLIRAPNARYTASLPETRRQQRYCVG